MSISIKELFKSVFNKKVNKLDAAFKIPTDVKLKFRISVSNIINLFRKKKK